MKKPEITIKSISGGMLEFIETGECPSYHTIRSRKYKRSWQLKKFPVELKVKGEVVYKVKDPYTVFDKSGERMEDMEFIIEMRD
jgi:hypothetical protein